MEISAEQPAEIDALCRRHAVCGLHNLQAHGCERMDQQKPYPTPGNEPAAVAREQVVWLAPRGRD